MILLRSIFSEFKHKISRFYSDKDIEHGGIQKTDIKGNKELIGFISLSAGVMSVKNEYYDSFHKLLAKLIRLKPLTKNDQGVCVAHELEGSIEQYCFEENEFELYVDESQSNQAES
jgi:hypothetical protein